MAYIVKEIFYSLQGEGVQAGRPAVFCRFSGCNLWSGRPEDRADALCKFCDTDFVGTDGSYGGVYGNAEELVEGITQVFPRDIPPKICRLVILTGGEPALQVDDELVRALHERDIEIAIETNGTLGLPEGIDWITVSPKTDTELSVRSGTELKLVYPQEGISPEMFEDLDFKYLVLQPRDDSDVKKNTGRAVEYCLSHPRWRLSLQIHKILNIR
jgi:7-carboxy-7-deazaguanine synthase (Cx14CxxC type)